MLKSQFPSLIAIRNPSHTLRMVENLDLIVTHRVQRCSACVQSPDSA